MFCCLFFAALEAEMQALKSDTREKEIHVDFASNQLGVLTQGMAIWASTVTIILIIIVALIFRRLRKSKWSNAPPSSFSDAESGVSESSRKSFETCSVVDVDMLAVGLDEKGCDNEAFDTCSSMRSDDMQYCRHQPTEGLDTELNEDTIEAVANLPEDPEMPEVHHKDSQNTGGDSTGMVGSRYRMAPYSLKLNESPPGNSFL